MNPNINPGAIYFSTSPQPSSTQLSSQLMPDGGGAYMYTGSQPSAPSATPTNAPTTNTGGTGGTTGTTATANPFSTAQQYFMQGLPTALQNIQQGGADAFQNAQNNLQGSANSIFSGYRTGQQNIDLGRQNNELSRLNAQQSLLSYIHNGLHQGGSRLASMNATDSSAAPALAQAYGLLGAQQSRGINNDAAVQGHSMDIQQNTLGQGLQDQLGQFHLMRDNLANQIGDQVRSSLAALDQQRASLSLPDQIQVEQQKQQVVNQGMTQLQQVDQWLQGQLGTIQPQGQDQVQAAAAGLQQAGASTPTQFQFNPQAQQVQGGPSIDQLPLFSFKRNNQ